MDIHEHTNTGFLIHIFTNFDSSYINDELWLPAIHDNNSNENNNNISEWKELAYVNLYVYIYTYCDIVIEMELLAIPHRAPD